MIKTLGGVVLVVVDVIAVKAEWIAIHAAHHGSGVMEVGGIILVLNAVAWWLLLSGGSKPVGSRFGSSR